MADDDIPPIEDRIHRIPAEPRFLGVVAQGPRSSTITITNPATSEVVFSIEVVDPNGWEPPDDVKELWPRIDWTTVDRTGGTDFGPPTRGDGEPMVRKVLTAFIVEITLDGQVIPRPDFSDQYDMLRAATPADMLMAAGFVVEEMRADLVAELIQQRNEEVILAARNGRRDQ